MNAQRTPKPSPLAGEGAERQAAEQAKPAWLRREAGEGAVATNPSPGRSPSPGALRRPAGSRPPSPARGEGNEPAARDVVPSKPVSLARGLRARMTDAERKLWFALRDRRFANFKFRRQVPIGPYVADFVCFERRVVIEVDGGQHAGSARDERRDSWLSANNFLVLRFWNNDVLSNIDSVLLALLETLHERHETSGSDDGAHAGREGRAS
jgi:very-short-patch-repair endonuclease